VDTVIVDHLCRTFKVTEDDCKRLNDYFTAKIEPRMKKKYLSHLVAVVEDLINEQLKKQAIPSVSGQDTSEAKLEKALRRSFSIFLIENKNMGKAKTYNYNGGVVIAYNPQNDIKDIRLMIAHELGHMVNKMQKEVNNEEGLANLFAFLAINERNEHYKVPISEKDYIYHSDEEIINRMSQINSIR
jgi:hypothetical protein